MWGSEARAFSARLPGQAEKAPRFTASTKEAHPAAGMSRAGPPGTLESRTGTAVGWWSWTSRQLPDSLPLWEDLRQRVGEKLVGEFRLAMLSVALRCCLHHCQRVVS